MIDRETMVEILIKEFPDIEADITDETWAGLTHLEVSSFARYTQHQIDNKDDSELIRCFEIARRLMLEGDDTLQNAMQVSFLEHLNLRDGKIPRRWALDMMRTRGLNVTSAVERRMAESVRYAIRKAQRRGLKRLPEVLLPYT